MKQRNETCPEALGGGRLPGVTSRPHGYRNVRLCVLGVFVYVCMVGRSFDERASGVGQGYGYNVQWQRCGKWLRNDQHVRADKGPSRTDREKIFVVACTHLRRIVQAIGLGGVLYCKMPLAICHVRSLASFCPAYSTRIVL